MPAEAKLSSETTIQGKSVSPGVVTGPVKILQTRDDVAKVAPGDIVVVSQSHPAFAVAVMKSAGLISERGGALSHICIVSVEMGIPCITQADRVTELLYDGAVVCMNATDGTVRFAEAQPTVRRGEST